mgnify:CR=1 FL=1
MARRRSEASGGFEPREKAPPVIKIPHDPFNERVLLAAMMSAVEPAEVAHRAAVGQRAGVPGR